MQFGTTSVSGYVVETIGESRTSEDLQVFDESGEIRNHIVDFGQFSDCSIDVIPETGTATPAIGDLFTYTSATDGATQKFHILTLTSTEVQKDVVKWSITGKKHPNITLS